MQEILKWFIRLVRYDMKNVQNETALPERKRTDMVERKALSTFDFESAKADMGYKNEENEEQK